MPDGSIGLVRALVEAAQNSIRACQEWPNNKSVIAEYSRCLNVALVALPTDVVARADEALAHKIIPLKVRTPAGCDLYFAQRIAKLEGELAEAKRTANLALDDYMESYTKLEAQRDVLVATLEECRTRSKEIQHLANQALAVAQDTSKDDAPLSWAQKRRRYVEGLAQAKADSHAFTQAQDTEEVKTP